MHFLDEEEPDGILSSVCVISSLEEVVGSERVDIDAKLFLNVRMK
jgi:hypothetical protein